mmetsp:Transcript_19326/g.60724  ORF Transcript_19326/g.60724 Transcript_19326/m.60724 type:complete len:99 (+) Transcript_19326:2-298(+)
MALESLLRKRRLPQGASVRLEATLVCLASDRGWPGVPQTSRLDEGGCEDCLRNLAVSLAPDTDAQERVRLAKRTLEAAAQEAALDSKGHGRGLHAGRQ